MTASTIRNLNNVTTIYNRKVATVSLKLSQDFMASDDKSLNTIRSPDNVFEVLKSIYAGLDDDQEHLVLLVMNVAHDLVGFKVITSGGQASLAVDCKVLFRNALLLGANSIIIAHNHPAGHLKPSTPDINITRKIVKAGAVIDIELSDHIIFTPNKYLSMKAEMPELFVVLPF